MGASLFQLGLLIQTRAFAVSITAGILSGSLGCILYIIDKILAWNFMHALIPDQVVFNVFVVFASLVAAFRTSYALVRYTDAAKYLHELNACWFDAASTLMSFCRASEASQCEIDKFQQTMIRLVSLMNALSLDGLQMGRKDGKNVGYRFEVLGAEDLDDAVQQNILQATHKVEYVFQLLQQLVVDGMKSKVLSIPPPILSRSFQEMGQGLLTYHEAKKIACVPLPYAYAVITQAILIVHACLTPWMMAHFVKGAWSAFIYTFGGVFLMWLINGVADSLDNPFQKESKTLEATKIQVELNEHLYQLLSQAKTPMATVKDEVLMEVISKKDSAPKRGSFHTWAGFGAGGANLQGQWQALDQPAVAVAVDPAESSGVGAGSGGGTSGVDAHSDDGRGACNAGDEGIGKQGMSGLDANPGPAQKPAQAQKKKKKSKKKK